MYLTSDMTINNALLTSIFFYYRYLNTPEVVPKWWGLRRNLKHEVRKLPTVPFIHALNNEIT